VSEQVEGGSLHIGVLKSNTELLSPDHVEPKLFVAPYPEELARSTSPQTLAMEAIRRATRTETRPGLPTSQELALFPAKGSLYQGYLLRKANTSAIHARDYGLKAYTLNELHQYAWYLENADPNDVTAHFIRQIIAHMESFPQNPWAHRQTAENLL